MKTEEFTYHEVTIESEHYRAARRRTSRGHCSIMVFCKDDHVKMFSATSEGTDPSSDYEVRAREFVALLDKITDNPCKIPVGKA